MCAMEFGYLKEAKKDFISEENILKLGLLWMTLLGLWEEEITQKIKQYCSKSMHM